MKKQEPFIGVSCINFDDNIKKIFSVISNSAAENIFFGINIRVDDIKNLAFIKRVNQIILLSQEYQNVTPVIHTCDTLRFNINQLRKLSEYFPNISCVQLNDLDCKSTLLIEELSRKHELIVAIDNSTLCLIEEGSIHKNIRILIDFSKGRGVYLNKEKAEEIVKKIIDSGYCDIGLAGGFGPDNLDTYQHIRHKFNIGVSIDAQSKLYTGKNLSTDKILKYIHKVVSID